MNDKHVSGTAERPWEVVFSEEERRIYDLYRRPDREAFPWSSCALLIVDVTYAFLGARLPTIEAASRLRTACGLPAWNALEPIKELLKVFHRTVRPVIFTIPYPEGAVGGVTIGAPESGEGNEVAREIAPAAADIVIEKPRASAFFATPLAAYLVRSGIRGLLVVGGSTSGCVRASVLDGSSAGFAMAIAHDGCFDRSQLSHSVALHELDVKYSTVVDSRAAIQYLTAAPQGASRGAASALL
jgi:nicotinamidase-related amidase